MLLADFASLFNEGHVKQKPGWVQSECVCEKQDFIFQSSKLQFSSLRFWWFSSNFCEPETLLPILYPPTHPHTCTHANTHTHTHTYTHTHSYKLGSTWIDTMWTDIPSCPSETLRCAALKVLKLLSASSPPVSMYPFIFPSFNPPIPHLSLCFSKILISHFLRFYYF